MIQIQNLTVEVDKKLILKNLNLNVSKGETHSIMGPNGSGKSTLFKTISGHPECKVISGKILYKKESEYKNLLEMDPVLRAKEGIFMSFQHPIEVPGVNNIHFLRTAFNSVCKHQGVEDMNEDEFLEFAQKRLEFLKLDKQWLYRPLNESLSGGEKKKNELIQMAILSPSLFLLDEIDSGLDIDSIKLVSEGLKKMKNKNNSMILITHYHRLLKEFRPDFVHVLMDGQIKKTGDYSLSIELDKEGYDQWI